MVPAGSPRACWCAMVSSLGMVYCSTWAGNSKPTAGKYRRVFACGISLAAHRSAATLSSAARTNCSGQTPQGLIFCRNCGLVLCRSWTHHLPQLRSHSIQQGVSSHSHKHLNARLFLPCWHCSSSTHSDHCDVFSGRLSHRVRATSVLDQRTDFDRIHTETIPNFRVGHYAG